MRNYKVVTETAVGRCCSKIGVLKSVAIFTGKHPCWDLFSVKLQDLRPAT